MVMAKHNHKEVWYQTKWCEEHDGILEYVLTDKTRVDCLTEDYAIEFDFGSKWAEAIGQSLHYGAETGRQPGVVLIIEKGSEYKYWIRLNNTVDMNRLPIKTWIVLPE